MLTDIVSSIGPASAVETFKGPIEGLTKSSGTAGLMLIVGIASALWTASGYVGAFMRASNVIYEVEEGRSFIKLRPLQMLVTLVLVVLLALVLASLVLTGPIASAVGSAVGLGDTAVTVWNIAKWPVLFLVVVFMITMLYYASPNAKLGGLKPILPGSALAIVVWLLASLGFAFYVANFGSYNKTYGALGGVIIFLVWLWITNVAILLGAELNAERERSRQLARTSRAPSVRSSSRNARRRRRRSARGPREESSGGLRRRKQELRDRAAEQPRDVHLRVAEALADLGLRELLLVVQAHDLLVSLVQRVDQRVEADALEGAVDLVVVGAERVDQRLLAVVHAGEARLVERVGAQRPIRLARLEHVLDVDADVFGELCRRGRRAERGRALHLGPLDAHRELLEVARYAHRPAVVAEMPLDRAGDAGDRERGERIPARGIEPVDRLDQREEGDLLEVLERLATAAMTAREAARQR